MENDFTKYNTDNNNSIGTPYQRYNSPNWSQSLADRSLINNDFNEAFRSEELSVLNEPGLEYEKRIRFVSVSSLDRNTNDYPNPNYYMMNLQETFRNVYRIELVQAIIPDQNNVNLQPFLLLNISEIDNVITTNNLALSNSFAVLQSAPAVVNNAFINTDKRIHENIPKIFTPPKASLEKMTISIRDYAGNLFNFGTDTTPKNINLQNWFFFKITTLEKKMDVLQQRNVY
jgi:hypothetical protein